MLTSESAVNSTASQYHSAESQMIRTLIADLNNSNGIIRQKARIELVSIGEAAVDALIAIMKNKTGYAHWEAAKALSQIGSPKAAQALVKALEDDQFSVRWLAAEGLIAIGRDGLAPLLRALEYNSGSVRLREGAHHVLHDMVSGKSWLESSLKAQLRPVLTALNDIEPALAVPRPAQKALRGLNS